MPQSYAHSPTGANNNCKELNGSVAGADAAEGNGGDAKVGGDVVLGDSAQEVGARAQQLLVALAGCQADAAEEELLVCAETAHELLLEVSPCVGVGIKQVEKVGAGQHT